MGSRLPFSTLIIIIIIIIFYRLYFFLFLVQVLLVLLRDKSFIRLANSAIIRLLIEVIIRVIIRRIMALDLLPSLHLGLPWIRLLRVRHWAGVQERRLIERDHRARRLGHMSSIGKWAKLAAASSLAWKPQLLSWQRMSNVAGVSLHVTRAVWKFGSMPRSLMMGMPRMVLTVTLLPRPKKTRTGLPELSKHGVLHRMMAVSCPCKDSS
jgi:hypothetical protein